VKTEKLQFVNTRIKTISFWKSIYCVLIVCLSGCAHLDKGHQATCEKLIQLSQNLDDFLADPRADEDYNRSRWRIGGGTKLNDEGVIEFSGKNSLKIDLPGARDRWGILVGGFMEKIDAFDVETGKGSEIIPAGDGSDNLVEGNESSESFLRFYSKSQQPLKWDFDVGLKYNSELQAFTRLRCKRKGIIGRSKYYVAQQLIWKNTEEGFGLKTQLELDQKLRTCAILREFMELQYHEISDGIDVYSGLKLRTWAGKRMAISLEWINFVTTDPWEYKYAEFIARFRRSIGRPWFEIEVTPQLKMKRKNGVWDQQKSLEVVFAFVFDAKRFLLDKQDAGNLNKCDNSK